MLGPGEGSVQDPQGGRGLLARGVGGEPPQGRRALLDRRGAAARTSRLREALPGISHGPFRCADRAMRKNKPKDEAVSSGRTGWGRLRRWPVTNWKQGDLRTIAELIG